MVRRFREIRESFPATPPRTRSLRTVFHALSYLEIAEPYTFHRHQHLNFEILVVDHGTYHCTLNGQQLRLGRNQILVVKPGDWHEDILTPPVAYFGLQLKTAGGALVPPCFPLLPDAEAREQVADVPRGEFWPLLRRLRQESRLHDALAPLLQETTTAEFFWRLLRRLPQAALDPRFLHAAGEQRFAAQLQQLFAVNQNSGLSLARMAAALGMSRSSLSAKCRAQLALSPAQAFRRFRVERAMELLTGTGMSVTEVANHLGFENPYHFSRVFRRHYGRPPSRA
jgi:AraC-like DNA-binding protein